MLKLKNYKQEIDELEPGATCRINHTDCPAGEDTRRRLYLTRTMADPTKVVGYCHNCQEGGVSSNKQFEIYRDMRHQTIGGSPLLQAVDEVRVPDGLIHKQDDWPNHAKAWAYGNGMGAQLVNSYGIAYDPSTDRVYLPRYKYWYYPDGGGDQLIGYQLRDLTGKGSKYMTVQSKEEEPYSVLTPQLPVMSPNLRGNYAVIVEDLVSAIHVAEAHQSMQSLLPDVYVNYGVKIQNHMLWQMRDKASIQIWLDNDSPHVIKQAEDIARTAQLFAQQARVNVVTLQADPKHLYRDYQELVVTMDDSWVNNG